VCKHSDPSWPNFRPAYRDHCAYTRCYITLLWLGCEKGREIPVLGGFPARQNEKLLWSGQVVAANPIPGGLGTHQERGILDPLRSLATALSTRRPDRTYQVKLFGRRVESATYFGACCPVRVHTVLLLVVVVILMLGIRVSSPGRRYHHIVGK
jgi:hypothetical protein